MGMMMIKESMEKALDEEWCSSNIVDVVFATSIDVKKKIKNPRNLNYLSVRIRGIPLYSFDIAGSNQILESDVVKIDV